MIFNPAFWQGHSPSCPIRVATALNRVVPKGATIKILSNGDLAVKYCTRRGCRRNQVKCRSFASSTITPSVRKLIQRRDGPLVHPQSLHNRVSLGWRPGGQRPLTTCTRNEGRCIWRFATTMFLIIIRENRVTPVVSMPPRSRLKLNLDVSLPLEPVPPQQF